MELDYSISVYNVAEKIVQLLCRITKKYPYEMKQAHSVAAMSLGSTYALVLSYLIGKISYLWGVNNAMPANWPRQEILANMATLDSEFKAMNILLVLAAFFAGMLLFSMHMIDKQSSEYNTLVTQKSNEQYKQVGK